MTTTSQLVDVMVAGLAGRTVLEDRVYSFRDWPVNPDVEPIGLFELPKEAMTSLGRGGAPQFETRATVPLHVRLRGPADINDAGAVAMRGQLVDLADAIKRALINHTPLWQAGLEEFATVNVDMRVTAEGREHIGEMVITFGLAFYQGPEDFFDPVAGDDDVEGAPPLEELQVTFDITQGDSLVIGPRLKIDPPQ